MVHQTPPIKSLQEQPSKMDRTGTWIVELIKAEAPKNLLAVTVTSPLHQMNLDDGRPLPEVGPTSKEELFHD